MLPPFPSPRAVDDALCAPSDSGVTLRPLDEGDLPWLRALYASTRADELAPVPWPDAVKRTFLDQQFELQHRHFVTHFGDAAFLAIERNGAPVGRLYLLRGGDEHLVVDIALVPDACGHGLGNALLRAIQDDAASRGAAVVLHVAHGNPRARRLYERLGFVADADTGTHAHMRWRAGTVS